jgi:hypothetical protein
VEADFDVNELFVPAAVYDADELSLEDAVDDSVPEGEAVDVADEENVLSVDSEPELECDAEVDPLSVSDEL